MKFTLLGLAALLLSTASSSAADIHVMECSTTPCPPYAGFIRISGEIAAGDNASLGSALTDRKHSDGVYVVMLDSPGGSVLEAMRLGTSVRAAGLGVLVSEKSRCMSACIYVLAAGVQKWPVGKIGIHRPFFSDGDGSDAASLTTIEAASEQYFKRMNIPARLSEDMFSTPPEEMRILSPAELRQYRLDQTDMVAAEETAGKAAYELGISRAEYNRRLAELNASGAAERCTNLPIGQQMDCQIDALISHGLLPIGPAR